MGKSKILLSTILVIVILTAAVFAAAFYFMDGIEKKQPDDMFVYPFSSQADDIKIVNGEKEYFAVKEQSGMYESCYIIYDSQLNLVLETGQSLAGNKAGRYLPLGNQKDQWWLLDVETLELRETDLIEPVVHESGEYMAGQRDINGETHWVVERTKNGTVLWEGTQKIKLPSQQWYAVAKAGTEEGSKERDQIINLKTGKVEYTAKEGETIVEGGLGYWEIDYELAWDYLGCEEHFFGTYLLDENYEMAFDGQLFGSVYLNGDYICGELEQDQFMRDIDRLKFNPLGLPGLKGFIWTAQGDDVYRTRSNLHVDILGIRGNTVAVQNDRGQYGYWKVEGSGSEAAITKRSNAGKRFNYWDAEDGFMRTCIDVDDTIYQLNMTNVPEDENKSTNYKAEAYRWGFVDRNMDLIVPYTYTYASETENGLAIVKNTDGQFAVIDLKRLGD